MLKLMFLCLLFGVVVHSQVNFPRRVQRAHHITEHIPKISIEQYIQANLQLALDENETSFGFERREPTKDNPLRFRIFQTVNRRDGRGTIELPIYVEAMVNHTHLNNPRPSNTPDDVKELMGQMERKQNDHAGHLIAASLGGSSTDPKNYIPMAPRVNTFGGFWWKKEGELKRFLQRERRGKIVWQMIIIYWDDLRSYRSLGFCLRYTIYDNNKQKVNNDPQVFCFYNEDEVGKNANLTFGFTDFYQDV